MQYLRRGPSQGKHQQHLEDLEEILNTPAPSLNHELSNSVIEGSQPGSLISRIGSTPDVLSSQPVVSSSQAHLEGHQHAAHNGATDAAAPSKQSRIHEQLLAWQSSAYRTAIAPFAAIKSKATAHLSTQQAQDTSTSWSQTRLQMPNLVEHLASNKGAAVAASVAGAAAGGAIAGPLGVAAGAKTGAFMIAVGAAAAGAAQQYYLPIKPAQAKPAASA